MSRTASRLEPLPRLGRAVEISMPYICMVGLLRAMTSTASRLYCRQHGNYATICPWGCGK